MESSRVRQAITPGWVGMMKEDGHVIDQRNKGTKEERFFLAQNCARISNNI